MSDIKAGDLVRLTGERWGEWIGREHLVTKVSDSTFFLKIDDGEPIQLHFAKGWEIELVEPAPEATSSARSDWERVYAMVGFEFDHCDPKKLAMVLHDYALMEQERANASAA